jgi:hypothetical protein
MNKNVENARVQQERQDWYAVLMLIHLLQSGENAEAACMNIKGELADTELTLLATCSEDDSGPSLN